MRYFVGRIRYTRTEKKGKSNNRSKCFWCWQWLSKEPIGSIFWGSSARSVRFSRLIDKPYLENYQIEDVNILELEIKLFIIFIYFLADMLIFEEEVEAFQNICEIVLIYIIKKEVGDQLIVFH